MSLTFIKKLPGELLLVLFLALYHGSFFFLQDRFFCFDSFYHFAIAREVFTGEIFRGISRLPYTILGDAGPDHHLLFHVLIAPFTLLEQRVGFALAAAFFSVLPSVGLYYLAKWREVPLPAAIPLLLLSAVSAYTARFSMLRVQSLVLPMILLSVFLLIQGRSVALLILGVLFSWSYHGFVLCLPLSVIALCSVYLTGGKVSLRAPAYLLVGLCLGQIVNPYLPENFEFLFFHTLFSMSNPLQLEVGNEWSKPELLAMITQNWVVHLAFSATLLAIVLKGAKAKADTIALLGCWGLFLFMTAQHVRFVEYWIPCEVLVTGLLLRDLRVSGYELSTRVAAPLIATLLVFSLYQWSILKGDIRYGVPYNRLQNLAEFLRDNSEKDETVINLHWDDFPPLYFHYPHNRYATGLDPNFLAYGSPERNNLLIRLRFGGGVIPNLGQKLRQAFDARYIIAYPEDEFMFKYPELKQVFRSEEAIVWEIASSTDSAVSAPAQ